MFVLLISFWVVALSLSPKEDLHAQSKIACLFVQGKDMNRERESYTNAEWTVQYPATHKLDYVRLPETQ